MKVFPARENSNAVFLGKINRSGNSLVIVIPKAIREYLELKEGDYVYVSIKKAKRGDEHEEERRAVQKDQ